MRISWLCSSRYLTNFHDCELFPRLFHKKWSELLISENKTEGFYFLFSEYISWVLGCAWILFHTCQHWRIKILRTFSFFFFKYKLVMKIHHQKLCGYKQIVYCNILLTDTSWWLFSMHTKIGMWKNLRKLRLYIVSGTWISLVCHGKSLSIEVAITRL